MALCLFSKGLSVLMCCLSSVTYSHRAGKRREKLIIASFGREVYFKLPGQNSRPFLIVSLFWVFSWSVLVLQIRQKTILSKLEESSHEAKLILNVCLRNDDDMNWKLWSCDFIPVKCHILWEISAIWSWRVTSYIHEYQGFGFTLAC